jgi:hypothetical protein
VVGYGEVWRYSCRESMKLSNKKKKKKRLGGRNPKEPQKLGKQSQEGRLRG